MDTRMQKIEKNVNKIDGCKSGRFGNVKGRKKPTEIESNIKGISNVFDEVNKCSKECKNKIDNISQKIILFENETKSEICQIKAENEHVQKLESTILDLQCRSMKNNLIFTGLSFSTNEDCEVKLRSFIYEELHIERHIESGNVHRFGKLGEMGSYLLWHGLSFDATSSASSTMLTI